MLNIFRLIPHPNYGHFGGCYNSQHGKKPIDDMDACFERHDRSLQFADKLREIADNDLYDSLKNIEVSGWYARAYRKVCMWIFKPKDM